MEIVSEPIITFSGILGFFFTSITVGLSLMGYAWVDNSLFSQNVEFCENIVWLLIRIVSISDAFLSLVTAIILTRHVRTLVEEKGQEYNRDIFGPMFFLIMSNVGIEMCGSVWDIFFRFGNQKSCHDLTGHDTVDAAIWIIFKLSVVNLWMWPIMYAYSPLKFWKAENYDSDKLHQDDFYNTETGRAVESLLSVNNV